MKFNISLPELLNSRAKIKIVKFLLTHQASMSEREIASVLKVSHMSINRTLRELSGINLVDFIAVGKAHLWKVNRSSYAFRVLSEFINGLSRIPAPLEDLKTVILEQIPEKLIKKALLFGSVAGGIEKADSDIDVFFLVKDAKTRKKLEIALERLSNSCLERYGNRLSPYILTKRELELKRSAKLIAEIKKGMEIFPSRKDKA